MCSLLRSVVPTASNTVAPVRAFPPRRPARSAREPGRRARPALGGIPVRRALIEGRPGDVQVRPAHPVGHELPQEQPATSIPPYRSGATLARSATAESRPLRSSSGSGIGHMASPARPAAATTASRSASSLAMTPAIRGPSATSWAPVSVATSTTGVGRVLDRTGPARRPAPAALGVGVEHLDGLAAVDGDDVGRALRAAARHVLGHRQVADDVHRGPSAAMACSAPSDRRRAAHVGLHGLHRLGRLQRQPAGVERDALADEHHRLRRARGGAYSSRTSRGGCTEPWPTPRMPP